MVSHSGQVFLDHGVHPIYDKNDKEATSGLKVSVISISGSGKGWQVV